MTYQTAGADTPPTSQHPELTILVDPLNESLALLELHEAFLKAADDMRTLLEAVAPPPEPRAGGVIAAYDAARTAFISAIDGDKDDEDDDLPAEATDHGVPPDEDQPEVETDPETND